MEEAYNLWALLYYDLGIEYPPYDLPQGHSKMNLSFFEQRIYQSLKRKGLAPQFERAGIYAILLDGKTVYIGKSVNMLARMAQHYA